MRRGRYRCGCPVDVTYSGLGIVPVCMRHGDRLSLRTQVARRIRAWLGRLVGTRVWVHRNYRFSATRLS